jgi:hypothetical protein
LDDDPLVHMMWKLAARHAGKSLLALALVSELRAQLPHLSHDIPIYLDIDLGSQGSGETIAQELHTMGFTELYLVTGFEADRFAHLPWLKGVLGKEAPWKRKD